MVERLATGIKGLDELIEGGIPKGNIVLIAGSPGTGKTIFCAQIAYNNALKGKKCLYLNLEQNEGRLQKQMEQFGWDIGKVKKTLKIVKVDSTNLNLTEYILKQLETEHLGFDLIVVDSLDSISSVPVKAEDMRSLGFERIAESVVPTMIDLPSIGRMKLKKIFDAIAKGGATALLTSESLKNSVGITRDTISEFLCDGIIFLDLNDIAKKTVRSIKVRKMRETKHDLDSYLLEFTNSGLVVNKENVYAGEKISGITK